MKIILKFLIILLIMWPVYIQSQQIPDNPKTIERTENVVKQHPKKETKKQEKVPLPFITEREHVEQKGATATNKRENEKKSGFTNRLRTDPIYLITFFLVFATFGLWYATYQLVVGTMNTAKRQLRAYVFASLADGEKMFLDEDGRLSAPLIIKNYGQTPAHNLKCSVFIGPYKIPLAEALDPPNYINGSTGCIAPGQMFRHYPTVLRVLTEPEIKGITSRKYGMFIWGYLEYVDVFKSIQKVQFRMVSTGEDFTRGELAYCEEGNNAT